MNSLPSILVLTTKLSMVVLDYEMDISLSLCQTNDLTSLVLLLLPDASESGNDEAINNAESGHSSHLYNSKINCLKTWLTHR